MPTTPNLDRATDFIWRNARLIDRLRYAHLFMDGAREPVLAALRPYQNADGGFGNAIEPDLRGPESEPVPTWNALEILDEIDGFSDPMLNAVCTWLESITTDEGGVPFVLPASRAYPHAPWWETPDNPPASLLPTAGLAGLMHKNGFSHPWLVRATDFCWRNIEALEATSPYEMHMILSFLDHAPDRDRAEAAFARISPKLFEQHLVALEVGGNGTQAHLPLDYAPHPDMMARRLFSDDVINAHLDATVAGQKEDGGWTFSFPQWNAATTLEWRAFATIGALKTLRAYGRMA
jgi:hypothetical protein